MAKGLKGEEAKYRKVSDLLLLLSCGKDDGRKLAAAPEVMKKHAGGAFECKTCSRRFPTFQALGGHRTSHGRVQQSGAGQRSLKKPKVLRQRHECSICGLAFHMGQALGGHMRRHKLAEAAETRTETKKAPWLDLNLPPLEIDLWPGVL